MRDELVSVDPGANRFRFFAIEVRAVPGAVELHRRWGRLGAELRHEVERFASIDQANIARRALLERRSKRGYVPADRGVLERARRELAAHRARRRAPRQLAFPASIGF